jgi:hypothetical protein
MRTEFKLENAERKDHLEDLDVGERILIIFMFEIFYVECGTIKLAQKWLNGGLT